MTDPRPFTIVCDIDGCLFSHDGDIVYQYRNDPKVLPGVLDKIREWDRKGYNIILLTGRKESTRQETIAQLSKAGIVYDQLIMGVGGGKRILINDFKPNSTEPTAVAVNLERNKGMEDVDI